MEYSSFLPKFDVGQESLAEHNEAILSNATPIRQSLGVAVRDKLQAISTIMERSVTDAGRIGSPSCTMDAEGVIITVNWLVD